MEGKETKLKIAAKHIPLVAPFMATVDIRYYLCGINVRPHKNGGAIIAATNGHVMAIAYDRTAEIDDELTLRVDRRTVAACNSKKEMSSVILRNSRLTVIEGAHGEETYIQAGNPIIDTNSYPKYQRVVPSGIDLRPGLVGDFNPEYLATAQKAAIAACKLGMAKHAAITFFNSKGDPTLPALARIPDVEDFLAVLMPMRGDLIAMPVPEWFGMGFLSSDNSDTELEEKANLAEAA